VSALDPARLARPFRIAGFPRLVGGVFVTRAGDWLTSGALVGWIYGETHSTAQVALLLLVRMLPVVLGGGIASALVDRLPKGRLLVLVEVARAALSAGMLAGVVLGLRPAVFAGCFLSGVLYAVSSVTSRVAVPSLASDEELPAANAAIGIANEAAMAIGALTAGTVLALGSVEIALVLDLATFMLAAALFRAVRLSAPVARGSRRLGEGFRYLLRRREVLVVAGSFAVMTIATGLANATFPGFLGSELGLGPAGYGFGLGSLAVGLMLGEAVAGLAPLHRAGTGALGAVLFSMAALFGLLAVAPHAALALALLFGIGFVEGVGEVLFETLVQRRVEPEYLGRVYGSASMFMQLTMTAGMMSAPLVGAVAAPHALILLSGLWLAGAGTIAIGGGRRAAAAAAAPAEA
jgi:hypothetical protein